MSPNNMSSVQRIGKFDSKAMIFPAITSSRNEMAQTQAAPTLQQLRKFAAVNEIGLLPPPTLNDKGPSLPPIGYRKSSLR